MNDNNEMGGRSKRTSTGNSTGNSNKQQASKQQHLKGVFATSSGNKDSVRFRSAFSRCQTLLTGVFFGGNERNGVGQPHTPQHALIMLRNPEWNKWTRLRSSDHRCESLSDRGSGIVIN